MSLLKKLFGQEPEDPTRHWTPLTPPPVAPDFNVSEARLGEAPLGADLQSFAHLGKPDIFDRREKGYFEIIYAPGGFLLGFDEDRLCYVSYYLGPDAFNPKLPSLGFATPSLWSHTDGAIQLTGQTRRSDVETFLGKPDREDSDEEETLLTFEKQLVNLEFEFQEESKGGTLKRLNIIHPDI